MKIYYAKNSNGKYLSADGQTRYEKFCGRAAYTYLKSNEGKHKRFAKISDADDLNEVFLEIDTDSIPTFRVDERREQYISVIRENIINEKWHLMEKEERYDFVNRHFPDSDFRWYFDLLCDFRHGGYRLLGDLICDIDDENKSEKRKKLFKDGDSHELVYMLNGYLNKPPAESFREAVTRTCLELIENKMKPSDAVQYAIALGNRKFMWDVLCDYVEENVLKRGKGRA